MSELNDPTGSKRGLFGWPTHALAALVLALESELVRAKAEIERLQRLLDIARTSED